MVTSIDISDREQQKGVLFSDRDPTYSHLKLFDAAMATGAAPYYFPPHKVQLTPTCCHQFVDGGLLANNPSMIGLM